MNPFNPLVLISSPDLLFVVFSVDDVSVESVGALLKTPSFTESLAGLFCVIIYALLSSSFISSLLYPIIGHSLRVNTISVFHAVPIFVLLFAS